MELDEPVRIGHIHIPESARGAKLEMNARIRESNDVYPATVVAVTTRQKWVEGDEGFKAGDRVVVALRKEDLGKRLITTHNTRIRAVIE